LKNLAVDEMAMGLKAEAKRDFQQLLKAVPDDPVAHTYLGEMLFAAGSYLEAKRITNNSQSWVTPIGIAPVLTCYWFM
jgi:predicted Zn-dependent protease